MTKDNLRTELEPWVERLRDFANMLTQANGGTARLTNCVGIAADLQALLLRVEGLDWFSGQHRLSLEHYSPIYGDDADQAVEWRVTEQRGNINDREYTTVGRGETAALAIEDARKALSQ